MAKEEQTTTAQLVVVTVGVMAVSMQIEPVRRILAAAIGRVYLHTVVAWQRVLGDTSSKDDDMKVSGLYIHPVKSFRPVSVAQAILDDRGLVHDRRFMLMTPLPLPAYQDKFAADEATHRFLTQRQCPSLATITADVDEKKQTLTLSSDKLPKDKSVTISLQPDNDAKHYLATLWKDTVQVVDMGDSAAAFCRAVVATDKQIPDEMKQDDVRLVVQAATDERRTKTKYTPWSALSTWWGSRPRVGLTDGFPILIANQASLEELNRRLVAKGKEAIPMSRFRPNIVVSGSNIPPFDEDSWKVISIDGVLFHIVKACPRCKQSCTDQITGQVYDEPLATLAEFRATTATKEDLFFAQNVIAARTSQGRTIRVGASVKVLVRGSPVWEA